MRATRYGVPGADVNALRGTGGQPWRLVGWVHHTREDVGMPFASGSLCPAGQPVPWYGPDPGGDPGPETNEDATWYEPSDGDLIAINVSDLGFSDTPEVDNSGSGGPISANTLVRAFSADEGDSPRLREVWIITFDELPS